MVSSVVSRAAMKASRSTIRRFAGRRSCFQPSSVPHPAASRPNVAHPPFASRLMIAVRHMTIAKYPPDSGDKQKAEEAVAASKLEQMTASSKPEQQQQTDDDHSDVDDNAKPTFEIDDGSPAGQESTHSYYRKLMGESLQPPAGCLWEPGTYDNDIGDRQFIPQVALHAGDGRRKKRVLVLCTGGTLTMAPDPELGGALAPVEGALSEYCQNMTELHAEHMPEITLHEYSPFYDSSDLGPADWARIAHDIRANYLHYDGFVVLTGG